MDITWNHLTKVLNDFAVYFIELARQNLTNNNSNASYDLYNSFEKIIEVGEDYFSVKISLEDYWKYLEEGRRPGKYPPPEAIRTWIELKPVTPQPDLNGRTPSVQQLTFLISRKIAERGTKAQPFFEPAKEQAIRDFSEKIDQAIDEDVSDYILEVVEKGLKDALT